MLLARGLGLAVKRLDRAAGGTRPSRPGVVRAELGRRRHSASPNWPPPCPAAPEGPGPGHGPHAA